MGPVDFLRRMFPFFLAILAPPRIGRQLVHIPDGSLEGYLLESRNGRTYKAFSGVPYGQAPIGSLRFKAPKPVKPWARVRQAKRNVRCVEFQFLIPLETLRYAAGQEDCLTLSIYTHSTDVSTKNPVMVHFHGGSFEYRFPPILWWNPGYFMDYDVVVVIVNYRLSMFGFLSFEDDVLPGNMGLKDQNLALRWVRKNIEYFGGDADRVTIMGESAGAASAHFQAISPQSRGLLSKIILQSGTALAPWAWDPPGEGRKKAIRLAEYAGCSRTTTLEIVECLRKMDARELAAMTEKFRDIWDRDPIVLFKPVSENEGPDAFITGMPASWQHIDIPLLGGLAKEDGLVRSISFLTTGYDFEFVSANLYRLLPESLLYDNPYTSDPTSVTRRIIHKYLNGKTNVTKNDEPSFSELYSDALFRTPLAKTVEKSTNDVYLYVNEFISPKLYLVKGRVAHIQEVFYLWEPDFKFNALEGEDLRISKDIVKLMVNFVISGDPNDRGSNVWKKTPKSRGNLNFLSWNNAKFSMMERLYEDAIEFWTNNGYCDLIDL